MDNRDVAARTVDATKTYGTGSAAVVALDGVSVELPRAQFTAIMGPSGAGKSTLMHCVAGLDSLTGGKVYIGGTELGSLSDRQLTGLRRQRVGFVFQGFNLLPTLTVQENVALPLALNGTDAEPDWITAVIDTVGLGDRLSHRPAELSGGQQQRVAIARALVTEPEIIFADEPTGNLDSISGTQVLELLQQAVSELGRTVVMVTHEPFAAGYADTAMFLADGRVVDSMDKPTAPKVLDQLKAFEEA